MADAMADLEAEIKKQREAQEAQANKLKAEQQALFDLSGSGQSSQQKPKPVKQTQGEEPSTSTKPQAQLLKLIRQLILLSTYRQLGILLARSPTCLSNREEQQVEISRWRR
jgi:hypothetical protein